MNILKNRPLATILIVLLGGFTLFSTLSLLWRVIVLIALLSVIATVACFVPRGTHKRFALVLLICAVVSALLSYVYFDLCFFADRRFSETDEVKLRGCIITVYHSDGYITIADIKADSINDEPASYVLRLYDEIGALGRVEPGDEITAKVTLTGIAEEDEALYMIGQGISAQATVTECIESPTATRSLSRALYILHAKLTERAALCSNEDAAGLLMALLFGNKQLLSSPLKLSFTRLGISHILALSGMHLSMLSVACIGLLSLFGVGKKTRTALLIPLILVYTVFTGAPSSLLRAAIMLVISSLLFLFRQCRDPITTLTVTVFLICAVTPHAVLDIGLWLSALATLGLLLMLDACEKIQGSFLRRMLSKLAMAFLLTFGALATSLLLSLIVFGGLSLLSPVATFIFGYLTQLYIYFGLLALIVGPSFPIGRLLIPLYDNIAALADRMASGRYVYVDATFPAVRLLAVIFTVCLILYVLLPVRHRRAACTTLTVLFFSIYLTATGMTWQARQATTVSYASVNTEELFLLTSENRTAAIDLGRGGRDFGESTCFYLNEHHLRYLDAYILTRYSVYLPQTVEEVLCSVRCHSLYVPYPQSETETAVYERLKRMSDRYGVELIPYGVREAIDVGGLRYEVLVRRMEDTALSLWMYIAKEDYIFTYFSRGSITEKTEAAATEIVARSDAIMFGSCGHSTEYVLDIPLSERVKQCIIADRELAVRKDTYASYQKRTKVILHPKEYTVIR